MPTNPRGRPLPFEHALDFLEISPGARCTACNHAPRAHDETTGRCLFQPNGNYESVMYGNWTFLIEDWCTANKVTSRDL